MQVTPKQVQIITLNGKTGWLIIDDLGRVWTRLAGEQWIREVLPEEPTPRVIFGATTGK